MNIIRPILLISIFLSIFFTALHSQSYNGEELPRFRHQVKIGYPIDIGLELAFPKTGIHIGYNPTYKLHQYFAVEGQISYAYGDFNRNAGTFSRDGGDSQSLNALLGLRIYLLGESSRLRLYGNAMAGIGQFVLTEYNSIGTLNTDSYVGLGVSIGTYMQFRNQWSIGISLETAFSLVLKAGYTF